MRIDGSIKGGLFNTIEEYFMSAHQYWNDIVIEKQKAFWVEDENDPKLFNFLRRDTNLERCFLDSINYVNKWNGLRGRILDVGAGVAWTSAIVSKTPEVSKVIALDFSEHRIKRIAPLVFKQFGGHIGKFEGIAGDFYGQTFPDGQFNAVIFCQSLYHFSDLRKVLKEIKRILVPGGSLIVSCERISEEPQWPMVPLSFYKTRLRWLLKGRADKSGNHFWTDSEYRTAIQEAGLRYEFQLLEYPVYPKGAALAAGNHFGIKS